MNFCERAPHLLNGARCGKFAANEAGDDADIRFDVAKAARVEREEADGILQQFAERFRFERH